MMEKGGIKQMGDDLWRLDTGVTGHFTCDPQLLENCAECSRVLRCTGGNTFPIVGIGTLRLSLRSEAGMVCVTLVNVAHVLGLSHHLLSLRRIADAWNKYIGTREGIRKVFTKSGDELFAPSLLLLLFLTFSALVANAKKLVYTVANPALGLLNRGKKKKKKVWQRPPPPLPARAARSEKIRKCPGGEANPINRR